MNKDCSKFYRFHNDGLCRTSTVQESSRPEFPPSVNSLSLGIIHTHQYFLSITFL